MRKYTVVVAPLLAGAILLAGCSSSTKSASPSTNSPAVTTAPSSSAVTAAPSSAAPSSAAPSDPGAVKILKTTEAALTAAPSVHVIGVAYSGTTASKIDLGFGPHGTAGTITDAGYPISILTAGSFVYFKAADNFWTAQGLDAAKLKIVTGKWVKASKTDASFKDLASLADKPAFVTSLFADDTSGVTVAADKTIGGVACEAIQHSGGVLYVAKSTSRPVEIDGVAGTASAKNKIAFSDYGKIADPSVPPAAQTVNASDVVG
jgi:hypothetical protein